MNVFVITKVERGRIFGIWQENHPVTLQKIDNQQLLGSLYVGRVKNVVPNLKAAFVDIGLGENCFLSLEKPAFLAKGGQSSALKQGDEVIVQISREAAGLKPPALTSELTIPGHYAVLVAEHPGLSISSRITEKAWRDQAKTRFESEAKTHGFILRTEAYEADPEVIVAEMHQLERTFELIREQAVYRKPGSLLFRGETSYLSVLLGMRSGSLDRIVTDDPAVFSYLRESLARQRPEFLPLCALYDGNPSLPVVYSVDAELDRALGRRVYLPCGGFLVIDRTEALTVIDVNSGKNNLNRDTDTLYVQVNREAAREVCRQMRLRNLSGIILVDFVSMRSEADRREIWRIMQEECRKDPVPSKPIDYTRLGLVELTRKKGYKPLAEQFL